MKRLLTIIRIAFGKSGLPASIERRIVDAEDRALDIDDDRRGRAVLELGGVRIGNSMGGTIGKYRPVLFRGPTAGGPSHG